VVKRARKMKSVEEETADIIFLAAMKIAETLTKKARVSKMMNRQLVKWSSNSFLKTV
jgi:hypothetical protein